LKSVLDSFPMCHRMSQTARALWRGRDWKNDPPRFVGKGCPPRHLTAWSERVVSWDKWVVSLDYSRGLMACVFACLRANDPAYL
jgi:hypothetical protein